MEVSGLQPEPREDGVHTLLHVGIHDGDAAPLALDLSELFWFSRSVYERLVSSAVLAVTVLGLMLRMFNSRQAC